MYPFLRKHNRLHAAVLLCVVAFYATVCIAIDLFHTDRCRKGLLDPFTEEDLHEDEPCPACLFSAGYNSTQPEIAFPLPSVEIALLYDCTPPESVYVVSNKGASSIFRRGPPVITPS